MGAEAEFLSDAIRGAAPVREIVIPPAEDELSGGVSLDTGRVMSELQLGAVAKRVLDVTLSAILLVAFAPVLLVIAALIRLLEGGPAVFWQLRVGRRGREFWFPKFRSMRAGAQDMHQALLPHNDHGNSVTFKMQHDPRVTRIGRALRTLSLDELPQLWNVLKGEMSLVGPRPPLPCEVAQYTTAERRRLDVKPGLTCIWQVSGRSALPFERQLSLDLEYIERQSFWLDLKLLALTVPAVLTCKGAW